MGLRTFTIDFQQLASERSSRFDVGFIDFNRHIKVNSYRFNDLFLIQPKEKNAKTDILENISDKDFDYCEIGNVDRDGSVSPQKLNFSDRHELVEDYFKKIEKGDIQQVDECNILLSKVRPNLKKCLFVDEESKDYFYTTAFINLRPKKLNKILYYSLRTVFHPSLLAISRQGKGYPTLKEEDLMTLKFDKNVIDKFEEAQDDILSKIEPIEAEIKALKAKIIPPQDVIDRVFASDLGFNLEGVYATDQDKGFNSDFSQFFLKNNNARFSFRWNQLKRVQAELYKGNKDIVMLGRFIEHIQNGWSPVCNEEENGHPVLGIDSIQKNGKLSVGNPKFTQQTRSNLKDFLAKKGDFFVSRGNTVGLVALASIAGNIEESDQEFIFPDLMIRIKFDQSKVNKQYLAFLFNSIIGRLYFKYSAKGKNQTMVKISSKELYDFYLPIPSMALQEKIVSEIQLGLDAQEMIGRKVENKQIEIDRFFLQSLSLL